jgi:steroid 5-alpha reductase family enzyme
MSLPTFERSETHLNLWLIPSIDGATTFPHNRASAGTVGLLESTILPSFGIQSGLSLIAYGVARSTNRVEFKDWLWPSGQVLNVWWSAIGRRAYYDGIPISRAISSLSWSEKLLVGGFTLWGGRLFYRIASRSIRRGEDDPRYEELKQEEGFWNKSFFTVFLPEAAVQALITLPFTVPFLALPSETFHAPSEYYDLVHGLAIGLFTAGFGLEVLADAQLDAHLAKGKSSDLQREGVWSIVRHPKYVPIRVFSSRY